MGDGVGAFKCRDDAFGACKEMERADGFVVVPADSEGFAAGTDVDVFLYDL